MKKLLTEYSNYIYPKENRSIIHHKNTDIENLKYVFKSTGDIFFTGIFLYTSKEVYPFI